MELTILAYLHDSPFAKGVNYGNTYAVKAAGYLVAATAEFTARMQLGLYQLYRGHTGFMHAARNAAPIIDNGDTVVFINGYLNVRGVTG